MTTPEPDRMNVLLVDDQPDGLLALDAILSPLGQNLVKARSGREALRLLLQRDFAVVLLDVVMPDLDGFETAELIRSRDRSRDTPIIFLTALSRSETPLFRAYSVGAVDYIYKPIEPEILRSKVAAFVDLARKTELVRRQADALRDVLQREHERELAEVRARAELAEERTRLLEDLALKNAQLEQARASAERDSESKSRFLAAVSHELRTPLNSVIGFSGLLMQQLHDPLSPKQEDYVRNVLENGRHLLRVVNDLLDLSKAEAGRMLLSLERTAVAPLVGEAQRNISPLAEAAGVALECSVAPMGKASLDPLRFKQILLNLLSNAIKFTKRGGHVRLTAVEDGRWLHLEVADDGVGIPRELAGQLFREYAQAGVSNREGSGLGLALTLRLVELHGGDISLDSEPGLGTKVRVRLPVLSEAVAAEGAPVHSADAVPVALASPEHARRQLEPESP